jgi:hypothetical protein
LPFAPEAGRPDHNAPGPERSMAPPWPANVPMSTVT